MTPSPGYAAMLASPRCGAKTRSGKPCMSPAVVDKKRCRMHGGAAGSGAPKGNRNAFKHGFFTRESLAERKRLTAEMRQLDRLVLAERKARRRARRHKDF